MREAEAEGNLNWRCNRPMSTPSWCLLGIPGIPDSLGKKTEGARPAIKHAELGKRDKLNSDLLWLGDSALEDGEHLSESEALAVGIVEDREATLEAFKPLPRIWASGRRYEMRLSPLGLRPTGAGPWDSATQSGKGDYRGDR